MMGQSTVGKMPPRIQRWMAIGHTARADPELALAAMPEVGVTLRPFLISELTLPVSKEQSPPKIQAPHAPAHSSTPTQVVRRGRGRPRRNRPAIAASNAVWEVTKIARDKPSSDGWLVKVQAEAWLVEKDLPSLQNAIAAYRGKQGRTEGKRKSIFGGERRSARGKREKHRACTKAIVSALRML